MKHDDDVQNVLQQDGVDLIDLTSYENNTCTSIQDVKDKFEVRRGRQESSIMRGLEVC